MVQQNQYLFFVKHATGATYFDKSRVPSDKCPICRNIAISTFPILPNEEFAFNYNEKRGVELEFGLRKSKDRKGKERQ